ncbi:MAG TPA: SPFH domain-containing protein [Gemmatimonadaceae bacterium]|nr:SPFH domain-containing protein [Gemmatimonadaceae bacterium]
MIAYLKASPTTWVMQYKDGRLKREGAGLSFLYWLPTTTLVQVPLASSDVPFAFNEITADFQAVTVQGQLTYRVREPGRLAALLDYTANAVGAYRSEDPRKLPERLVNTAQVLTRAATQVMTLREALVSSDRIERQVVAALNEAQVVTSLGVEVLAVSILSIRPTPEMGRALEAEAREALQRKADEAIYDRRNAAVEGERRIRESELATDVMVEEKKRNIRERQMAADVAIETERAKLISAKVANDRMAADAQSYALDATLRPLRTLDWKLLQALGPGGSDPGVMIGTAFRELAENAQKIGELNISPDLLRSLLPPRSAGAPATPPSPSAPPSSSKPR